MAWGIFMTGLYALGALALVMASVWPDERLPYSSDGETPEVRGEPCVFKTAA